MYWIFQRDLCKLRLSTARAYVKVLTDGQGPMSNSSGNSIRLNATVQGLGPLFKIRLALQNTGTRPLYDIPVMLTAGAYTRPLLSSTSAVYGH
jgi:Bardet-Biedl syndrome 1 protein